MTLVVCRGLAPISSARSPARPDTPPTGSPPRSRGSSSAAAEHRHSSVSWSYSASVPDFRPVSPLPAGATPAAGGLVRPQGCSARF